jgi:hypothetical protein
LSHRSNHSVALFNQIGGNPETYPGTVPWVKPEYQVASMRDVERAVENVLSERIGVPERVEWNPVRKLEDFTLHNLRFLAVGAAGAVLALSSMTLFQSDVTQSETVDSIVVGSISTTDHVSGHAKWLPVQRPVQILSLEAQQLSGSKSSYAARRTEKGALQDSLSFEAGASKRADLRVTLTRGLASGSGSAPSLFIEMTRQQAERGYAVTKASQTGALSTKFGTMEVADMTFSGSDEKSRACLAFRNISTESMIGVSGWYCAAETNVTQRPELSCILDKLVLLKSGQDKELRRYFTEAEKIRTPCATTRVSTGRKPTWLDSDGKVPSFRGDITSSIDEQPLPKKR